jgi:SAM-dependent methyltransferase
VLLDWWECCECRGWFVYPVPEPEAIEKHWAIIDYNQESKAIELSRAKHQLQTRILHELSRRTALGQLLDFGCNFGDFLVMARDAGWIPYGFEPCRTAGERARARGFDVRGGWFLEDAGFRQGSFTAVTAIDSFYYVWSPIDMLLRFHYLLKPGGLLAMRITNKRFVLGAIRAVSQPGSLRDTRLSTILKAQFHTIGCAALKRTLTNIGFDEIQIQPGALTTPWEAAPFQTRTTYRLASILYYLSLKAINLSPGILVLARKRNESN